MRCRMCLCTGFRRLLLEHSPRLTMPLPQTCTSLIFLPLFDTITISQFLLVREELWPLSRRRQSPHANPFRLGSANDFVPPCPHTKVLGPRGAPRSAPAPCPFPRSLWPG